MTIKMTNIITVALLLVVGNTALADGGPRSNSAGTRVAASANKMADMTTVIKTVALANEVELQYVEQGDSSGVPTILLHGYTDSWHSYELVLPHLPKSIHAFALSQRGHGDSERPATGYHPRDFAADVAAFMDARKIERAVIVGHSMGSYIAQCFAVNYPERMLGLVLVGSDLSSELGKIKAPTLIVWGDKDAYFLRDQQDALVAGITGSRLVIYPGVGHGVHWEVPERFAADLQSFIENLSKPGYGVLR